MSRILFFLSTLLLLPGSALAYSSTQSDSTTSISGWDKTFTFNNLPSATGNVTVSVTQNGDFGHSTEYSDVYIDGANQGTINPNQSNIDCNNESGTYTVPASSVADGQLLVRVDASANVGTFCSGGIQYSVTVTYSEGSPPTADAGGPYTVNQGAALSLNGSGSTANTGSISLYEWDCTADGTYDTSSTSAVASSCTYPDDGAQTVRLRVTNSIGLSDTDTATVTVTNTAPVANAGGPYSANQGVAVALDGSGSSDPDGTLTLYEWDCTNNGSYDTSSGSPTASTCTYGSPGLYTVRLRVTDDDGATTLDQANVTITNTAPVANAGGPYSVNQGVALAVSGAASSDADGSIVLYEWDCTNDGSYDASGASATSSPCTYPDVGSYTLGLRVTDNDGATGTATAAVTVTNTAPVADAGGPYSVNQGVALAVSGAGSTDADGSIALYEWDCTNDGSYDASSTSATSSPCTYPNVGSFTLGLRVTDDDGATATDTASVSVTNTVPTADAGGPYTGTKGIPVPVDGSGSSDADGAIVEYAWDCDDDGTFEVVGGGPTATCTFAAVGSYTIYLRVTDDDGDIFVAGTTVSISNDPPVAVAGGPYAGDEAASIALDASGSSDAGSGSIVLYEWDCTNNGSYDVTGVTATCTYADDGAYTVGLRVTDDDGATDTDTASVTVANVAPTVTVTVPPTGDEGTPVLGQAVGSDASPLDAAALTYAWNAADAGGASVGTGTGASPSFVFADDGVYTLTVTVTDPQGATGTASGSVTIGNLDPVIVSVSAPTVADEGSPESFTISVDDPGAGDVAGLVVTWDWGDGTPTETGTNLVHTWSDDGSYLVSWTVTDDDGGSASGSSTIVVGNVAPTITSTAPTNALEGSLYSYTPSVTDPGDEVFTWSLSSSAPAGMTVDAATGLVEWTPTYDQSLVGSFSFVLTVDDGDGATDAQSITVSILSADDDGDGIADSWETDNGLDPTDPSDAGLDPDGDGLTNLEEFGQGTDPNSYDGPSTPVLFDPIAGVEVATDRPDLVVDNATDPQGDVLIYEYEVYSDAALTTLVTASAGVVEDASGQTSWKVDVPLAENGTFWWRARASDPFVASPWTAEESFFVNALEEAPEAPTLVYPIGGETTTTLTPELVWTEAVDVDGDALTYEVDVWGAAGVWVTGTSDVAGDGLEARWTVDVDLDEDAFYTWTARAVDEHGVVGPDAPVEDFFVDTDNAAPFGTMFVSPLDNAVLSSVPSLVATEGVDPEGGVLEYRFEIDSAPSFDAATEVVLPATGTGEVTWDLFAEGIALEENATTWARVRAIDEAGLGSTPDTISFFLRGDNDAPEVPVLLSPEDGAEGGSSPTFEVQDPTDPEGDLVYLDIVVARDAEATDVIDEVVGLVVPGTGSVTWTPTVALQGTVYWTARAEDEFGATSEWAVPFVYEAPVEAQPPAGDDDDADDPEGCACASSVAADGSASWMLLLVPLLAVRRRRG